MIKEKAARSQRLRAASEENKIDDDPTVPGVPTGRGLKKVRRSVESEREGRGSRATVGEMLEFLFNVGIAGRQR